MNIHQVKNWRFETPTNINDGDVFIMCNIMQKDIDTVVFSGISDLKFVKCNLINVKIEPTFKHYISNVSKNEYEYIYNEELDMDEFVFIRNLGKNDIEELSIEEIDEIFGSKKITNKYIIENFSKEIERAKESLKMDN